LTQSPAAGRAAQPNDLEVALAELVEPLRRYWRPVVAATLLAWVVIGAFVLLVPRYVCEGTLAMPNLVPPARQGGGDFRDLDWAGATGALDAPPSDEPPRTTGKGLSLASFKTLERTLADGAAFEAALRETLTPTAIERLRVKLPESVAILSAGSKDDLEKLGPEDTITALRLSYASRVPARNRVVVDTLARLVRDALLTQIALEQLEWESDACRRQIRRLNRRQEELREANRSADLLVEELARMVRELPSAANASRELVDTRGGGHRYLSLAVQLAGARATRAENEHASRVHGLGVARHRLRLQLLDLVRDRLRQAGSPVIADVPGIIGATVEEFVRKQGAGTPGLAYVRTDLLGWRDQLRAFQSETRFVQLPTTTRQSRTPLALALGALVFAGVVATAYVWDLLRRPSTPEPTGDGARAA
jgi:hypothetical protein